MNEPWNARKSLRVLQIGVLTSALVSSVGFSQSTKVIVLQNADSLVGRMINGEEARELIGNVRFSQENVRVSCDRALEYRRIGKLELTGHVVVNDDSLTMRAPRGTYYREERRAEAFDDVSVDDGKTHLTSQYGEYFVESKRAFFCSHVVVVDSATTLTADSLTYFRLEKRTIATSNVQIFYGIDNVTVRGNHFESFTTSQFSRMTDGPSLVQFDTSASGKIDTLLVTSMTMESFRDSVKKLVAIQDVQIVRSDLASIAGLAVFYTQGDSILLRELPVVWYQETQISGDSIDVYLRKRRLNRVHVMGDAAALSQSDSLFPERLDQLVGEQMQMRFVKEGLEKIEVNTRAISMYHLYEDTLGNGLNKTSGDKIEIFFGNGRVTSINVLSGVEGQYFPENMVKGHEHEFAIPGLQWRNDRPRIRPDDFRVQAQSGQLNRQP